MTGTLDFITVENIYTEYIVADDLTVYGPCLWETGVVGVVASRSVLWESEEDDLIFLDDLPFEEDELDEDGYYFYDEGLYTLEIGSLYIQGATLVTLWPFFDIHIFSSCSSWDWETDESEPKAVVCEPSLFFQTVRFETTFSGGLGRRERFWRACFRTLKMLLGWFVRRTIALFFVFLTTAGVGNFCEQLHDGLISLRLENTTTVLLFLPPFLRGGCVAPTGDSAESSCFFLFTVNYQSLRLYANFVRKQFFFNRYEERGLLYSGEIQRRKLTKQKPR